MLHTVTVSLYSMMLCCWFMRENEVIQMLLLMLTKDGFYCEGVTSKMHLQIKTFFTLSVIFWHLFYFGGGVMDQEGAARMSC